MQEIQAIIDFSLQINKFINIDLFQRGHYQIRLALKLSNSKLINKIELNNLYDHHSSLHQSKLQQQQTSHSANKTNHHSINSNNKSPFRLFSSRNGSSSYSLGNDQSSSSSSTLNDVEENSTALIASTTKSFDRLDLNPMIHHQQNNLVQMSKNLNGVAVSRTFQINYRNEEININNTIYYRLNVCLNLIDCVRQIFETDFILSVELWFTDRQYSPMELISQRQLKIHYNLAQGIHCCLPVIFDYFHLSAITLSVHGCLVSLCQPYINQNYDSNQIESNRLCQKNIFNPSTFWLSNLIAVNKNDSIISMSLAKDTKDDDKKSSSQSSSIALQLWTLYIVQWKVVALILVSLYDLKKSIYEYYRVLAPWHQAKINYGNLFVKITPENLSEMTVDCFNEIKNNLKSPNWFSFIDKVLLLNVPKDPNKPISDDGSNQIDNFDDEFMHRLRMKFQKENENVIDSETKLMKKFEQLHQQIEHDLSYLCGLTIEQWQRFCSFLGDHYDRINQHLAKRHHFQRLKRFSEGFFTIEIPRSNLSGSLCDTNSNLFSSLSEKLRKSLYFTNLPPCDIECLNLDGDHQTLPIIFEEKFENQMIDSDQRDISVDNPKQIKNELKLSFIDTKLSSPVSSSSFALSSKTSKTSLFSWNSSPSKNSISASNSPRSSVRSFFSKFNSAYERTVTKKITNLTPTSQPFTPSSSSSSSSPSSSTLTAPQKNETYDGDNDEKVGDMATVVEETNHQADTASKQLKTRDLLTFFNETRDINQFNRKIKFVNLLFNHNFFKNYTPMSFDLQALDQSIPIIGEELNQSPLTENRYSWPILNQSLRFDRPPENTFDDAINDEETERKAKYRKIRKLRKLFRNGINSRGKIQSMDDSFVSSFISVMNYRNFPGTMYFPRPPKEFQMEEVDEPAHEISSKPIPNETDQTQSKTKSNAIKPVICIEDEELDAHPNCSRKKSIRNKYSNDHCDQRKNSKSYEDLTLIGIRQSKEVTKDLITMPAEDHYNSISMQKSDNDLYSRTNLDQEENGPKTLISNVSNANDLKMVNLNETKFTFMELLKSDHCLICCGLIDHQQSSLKTKSSSTTVSEDLLILPCKCRCSSKMTSNDYQKKTSNNEEKRSSTIIHTDHHDGSIESDRPSFRQFSKFDPNKIVSFLHEKEAFRSSISTKYQNLLFYSDFNSLASRIPYFQCDSDFRAFKDLHLIVCVHGLDGNSADLRLMKTYLEIGLPMNNFEFLMSQRNQGETFDSLETLTDRLINEIENFISTLNVNPTKISFIGHSLGNIIIRAAITRTDFSQRWRNQFHTFLSLSGPHLGLAYNRSGLVNIGLWFIQKFKRASSLIQLSMKDSSNLKETFLYRLSKKSGLEHFRNILLCGSSQDYYVPIHSAHIELCSAALNDSSDFGIAYREMTKNILEPLIGKPNINIVRYDVHHALDHNTNSLIGRAAHIAVLDSELFIEKFLMVTGLKYFD
ncbi:Uncharacterized protein SSS_05221 [Sarcoptes scabiei]|uniref:DUF676 domain-containing protein n=1 Tax=Sarcoptes scabiei TaxID=52283 RepID=A0A834R3Y2_SARSC|nr:Uncharacterized protein SSS_05221 [Sarcoptes scabiei]